MFLNSKLVKSPLMVRRFVLKTLLYPEYHLQFNDPVLFETLAYKNNQNEISIYRRKLTTN